MPRPEHTLNEYQQLAWATAGGFRDKRDLELLCGLGIAGEAGEVSDLVKKRFFHPHRTITDDAILDELGDVLWYIAVYAKGLGHTLDDVADRNVQKLRARYPDGFPGIEHLEG